MRLGVVMMGTGALAAVCTGVMQELEARGIEPGAVCGIQTGAWPAALHMSGRSAQELRMAAAQAARMSTRMLRPAWPPSALLREKRCAMFDGRRLEHLLAAQAGQKMLCMCPKPGILLCRTAGGGRKVIFSSFAFAQDERAMLSMQASAAFAARAAMTQPPFLSPVQWMGSLLVAENDASYACRELLAMGMQRVLVIKPVLSVRHDPDALDLTSMTVGQNTAVPDCASVLQVEAPPEAGALSIGRMEEIAQAGRTAAQRGLDQLMKEMGMPFCRVLPFRQPYRNTGTR